MSTLAAQPCLVGAGASQRCLIPIVSMCLGGGALDHNEHPSVAVGLCKLREFVSFRKVGV